jgi:hypothetical protein
LTAIINSPVSHRGVFTDFQLVHSDLMLHVDAANVCYLSRWPRTTDSRKDTTQDMFDMSRRPHRLHERINASHTYRKNIGNINLVLMIYWFTYRHIKSESFISYIMITYFFVLTTSRVLGRISKHIKYESFISYSIITHFFVSTISRVLGRISNIWCT